MIAGAYLDANTVNHGFARTSNGAITTFNAPGAGTAEYQGTNSYSINSSGTITGFYIDGGGVNHGFVRTN